MHSCDMLCNEISVHGNVSLLRYMFSLHGSQRGISEVSARSSRQTLQEPVVSVRA